MRTTNTLVVTTHIVTIISVQPSQLIDHCHAFESTRITDVFFQQVSLLPENLATKIQTIYIDITQHHTYQLNCSKIYMLGSPQIYDAIKMLTITIYHSINQCRRLNAMSDSCRL